MKLFFKKIARVIVRSAIYAYCKIVHRAEIIGKENIPKEENFIFCGNHRNYLDPPLMVVTVGRHIRFMAKEDLKKNPFFAFLGVVFDGIYVKRDSKDVSALKTTLKALKKGESIALFPEGTRNGLEKGEKVKDGAAFFALKTGTRVIPVGISGGIKKFEKVKIVYGKPLDLSKYTEMYKNKETEKQALEEASKFIMDSIIELTK
ncbi:MAG: 1-acyl-sn-glycerol-3-phosphate acyltransferase [Clostridia bacterium]|nr:1-acyl-sn-glycerol-3-phosphate acyltransferase [Clostridia bacterium]